VIFLAGWRNLPAAGRRRDDRLKKSNLFRPPPHSESRAFLACHFPTKLSCQKLKLHDTILLRSRFFARSLILPRGPRGPRLGKALANGKRVHRSSMKRGRASRLPPTTPGKPGLLTLDTCLSRFCSEGSPEGWMVSALIGPRGLQREQRFQ
jgi:hypothetical protein